MPGQSADVQVIADGRNSNTAGTAMGYVGAIVDSFNADWRRRTWPHRPADPRHHPRLVQPEPRNALEHDSQPDRHADDAADAAADGDVGRPRAGAGDVRPAAGHAVSSGRDHGRQGAPVDASSALVQATTILLVAQLWFRIPFAGSFVVALRGADVVPAGGGRDRPVGVGDRRRPCSRRCSIRSW